MDCELQHTAWISWSTSIAVTAAIVATALVYLRGWRRLRESAPETAAGCKPWMSIVGLVVLWIAIASPLSTLDHRLLTFHMLQHLLSMTVAAPLILAGAPGRAILRGLPPAVRHAAVTFLRSDAARRIGRWLTSPIACWLIGTGVVIAWHVPTAHELSMRSHAWHFVQHVTFFAGGLLFWWPVLNRSSGRLPASSAPLYLFLATLPCDALSAFLSFCGRSIYPSHGSAPATFGLTALQDQELAGALMWFWVTIAYLIPAVAILLRMLSPRAGEIRSAEGKGLVASLNLGTR